MFQRQHALHNVTQTHRDNLQKRLNHRLEAARARGDQALVNLLEAEASYLNGI
jgi:DNA-binding transcriptional regulator YbjK